MATALTTDAYQDLLYGLNVQPDRRGECHVPCPSCGKEPKRGQTHFSFNQTAGYCFVCQARYSLPGLARALGLDASPALPLRHRVYIPPPPPPPPSWTTDARVLDHCRPLPDVARDYCHKRGLTDATIGRWGLAWGRLPASSCAYPRLLIPVYEHGQLVAIKGRAVLAEDTDPKWLSSAGSRAALFGADELVAGRPLIITEAPISAMLAMQEETNVQAVAAGGVNWRDEWTARVVAAQPSRVLLALDNDLAGREGAARIGNALLTAGVRAVATHRWPARTPEHYDLADLVLADLNAPAA